VLADFLMLGTGERGSFALSSDKTRVFHNALEGWLNSISSVLNRDLLPRLWTINSFDYKLMPRWMYGKVDPENIRELSESVERLSRAGMRLFPDDELEQHIRERAGFPDLDTSLDFDTLEDMNTADDLALGDE
jgi:phage gp29-like protein